jgi:hypothetical protein
MTLEIVDESDVRKAGDKEKKPELKPGLRLLDESEIKKIGNEKKSWLEIVNESEIREDPKIELVDKSDVREDHKVGEKVKKPELEFVTKERIINCGRQRAGLPNNCVLCKELSSNRFDKCPNKYGGF